LGGVAIGFGFLVHGLGDTESHHFCQVYKCENNQRGTRLGGG
jgi:hypothetical protein